jgi:hypothetical protein
MHQIIDKTVQVLRRSIDAIVGVMGTFGKIFMKGLSLLGLAAGFASGPIGWAITGAQWVIGGTVSALIWGVRGLKWLWDKMVGLGDSVLQDFLQSSGIGASIGGLRAFKSIFGFLPDDPGLFKTAQAGRFNVESRQFLALQILGVQVQKNTTDTIVAATLAAARFMKKLPRGAELYAAEAYGLTALFSPEYLVALLALDDRELELKAKLYDANKMKMELTEKAVEAWKDFNITLKASGSKIMSVIGEKLVDPNSNLVKSLTDLSAAIVKFLKTFAEVFLTEENVQHIVKGLKDLDAWLKSEKFKKDVRETFEYIKGIIKATEEATKQLYRLLNALAPITPAAAEPIDLPEVSVIRPSYPKIPQLGAPRIKRQPEPPTPPRPSSPTTTAPPPQAPRTTTPPSTTINPRPTPAAPTPQTSPPSRPPKPATTTKPPRSPSAQPPPPQQPLPSQQPTRVTPPQAPVISQPQPQPAPSRVPIPQYTKPARWTRQVPAPAPAPIQYTRDTPTVPFRGETPALTNNPSSAPSNQPLPLIRVDPYHPPATPATPYNPSSAPSDAPLATRIPEGYTRDTPVVPYNPSSAPSSRPLPARYPEQRTNYDYYTGAPYSTPIEPAPPTPAGPRVPVTGAPLPPIDPYADTRIPGQRYPVERGPGAPAGRVTRDGPLPPVDPYADTRSPRPRSPVEQGPAYPTGRVTTGRPLPPPRAPAAPKPPPSPIAPQQPPTPSVTGGPFTPRRDRGPAPFSPAQPVDLRRAFPPKPGTPVTPNFVPNTNQTNRPGLVRGTIEVDGKQWEYGTGTPNPAARPPGNRGSAPYGTWKLTPETPPNGPWYRQQGSFNIEHGTMQDPKFPNQPREGIYIHPTHAASKTLDQLYSAGCFVVSRDKWPAFRQAVLDKIRREGTQYITFNPNGHAVISNPGFQNRPENSDDLDSPFYAHRPEKPFGEDYTLTQDDIEKMKADAKGEPPDKGNSNVPNPEEKPEQKENPEQPEKRSDLGTGDASQFLRQQAAELQQKRETGERTTRGTQVAQADNGTRSDAGTLPPVIVESGRPGVSGEPGSGRGAPYRTGDRPEGQDRAPYTQRPYEVKRDVSATHLDPLKGDPGTQNIPVDRTNMIDRSRIADEAAKNPELIRRAAWMVRGEIGSLRNVSDEEKRVQLQTAMDRAITRDQEAQRRAAASGEPYTPYTFEKALRPVDQPGGYYAINPPTYSGKPPTDEEVAQFKKDIWDPVIAGDNPSLRNLQIQATGNASGSLAQRQAARQPTARFPGGTTETYAQEDPTSHIERMPRYTSQYPGGQIPRADYYPYTPRPMPDTRNYTPVDRSNILSQLKNYSDHDIIVKHEHKGEHESDPPPSSRSRDTSEGDSGGSDYSNPTAESHDAALDS